jgi:4-aminobutyrate aminotransferase-like enzyme
MTDSSPVGNGLPLSAIVTSNKIAEFAKEKHFLFYTVSLYGERACNAAI